MTLLTGARGRVSHQVPADVCKEVTLLAGLRRALTETEEARDSHAPLS